MGSFQWKWGTLLNCYYWWESAELRPDDNILRELVPKYFALQYSGDKFGLRKRDGKAKMAKEIFFSRHGVDLEHIHTIRPDNSGVTWSKLHPPTPCIQTHTITRLA